MTLAVSSSGAQIALIVAIVTFVGVIVWLWRTPARRWRRDARLPIDDAPRAPAAGSAPPDRSSGAGEKERTP